jgi:hypothetical protein
MPFIDRPIVRCMVLVSCTALAGCSADDGPTDPPGTSVELSYCAGLSPGWLAVQDGNGPWTRVLPIAEGRYAVTFDSVRGGVAYAFSTGGLWINYGTPRELATITCDYGYKELTGTAVGMVYPQRQEVALGATTTTLAFRDTFRLFGVTDGPHDLFAARRNPRDDAGVDIDRVIIRRDLDPPSNSILAPIDLESAEAFAPVTAQFSVTDPGAVEFASLTARWHGRGATGGVLGRADVSGQASGQYAAVPAERLGPDDLLSLQLEGYRSPPQSLLLISYFRSPGARVLDLGPTVATPTLTFPAGPLVRPRAQLPSQPEYGRLVSVNYSQYDGSAFVSVVMTSGYHGGTPATWDLEVPDLSSVDGWNDGWSLNDRSAIYWSVLAEGGVDRLLGDVVHDGDDFRSGYYFGDTGVPASAPTGRSLPEPYVGGFPRPATP